MSAPSGIVWGSIAYSDYRLGIYTSLSNTDTQTTVSIQVWLWTKYQLTDSSNHYYFDNNATTATTKIKDDIKISHTVDRAWDTSNQTLLGSHSYTYTRTTSNQTINCAAKITNIGSNHRTVTTSSSYTIPALSTCTISYNANGGSGAPGSQTKYYGVAITLSSTVPTRTGYTFLGWNYQSSTATTITHNAGESYNATNTNTTLYAVWQAHTYVVSYNANGGSGAPENQTKTYGVTLTLSSTVPTKTNYNFLGWATSANSTSVAYSAGGSYTTNAAIVLYAVWQLAYKKPRINNLKLTRADSSGNALDTGTYYNCYFEWETDYPVTSCTTARKKATATSWENTGTIDTVTGTSGIVDEKSWGMGEVSTEHTYIVEITISDSNGSTTVTATIPSLKFAIDFKSGGTGVAIGKAAEKDAFDIAMETYINDVEVTGRSLVPSFETIASTDDDTVANWCAQKNASVHSYSTNKLTDQPTQWGMLINYVASWGSDARQLWFNLPNGNIYHRGGNSYGWGSTWLTLLDSANYSNYALPLTGGTVAGYLRSSNTINTLGQYRFNDGWCGIFNSVDAAHNCDFSNRKGWFGFNDNNFSIIVETADGAPWINKAWNVGSDKRLKKDINDLPKEFIDIWKELIPKIFRWKSKDERLYFGLIAQDVIEAFEKRNLNPSDYGFVNSFTLPEDNTEYFGIAYDEYHMLTALVVKEQQKQIDSLEERIKKLENLILGQEE